MVSASIPIDEQQRLQCLQTLQILDTPPDPAIDAVTRLLAERLGCPIALLSLVDEHRQWFKSRLGLQATQTPREEAFCAHAILQDRQFVVTDATADARFADNPLVTGPESIRFYAGQPLLVGGVAIGTMCVLDRSPRTWSAEASAELSALAHIVEALLEAQWRERQAQVEVARLAEFARASSSLLWECDTALRVNWVNPVVETLLGMPSSKVVGQILFDGIALDELGHIEPGAPALHQALRAMQARPLAGAYQVETPSGPRVLGLSVTPVMGRGKVVIGWRGVARDIEPSVTARRQRQALEAAEERRRQQVDLMARVTHELRTPLNAIVAFGALLHKEVSQVIPPHCLRWLELMQAGGAHLVALVNDVDTFFGGGRRSLNQEAFAVTGAVRQTVELLEPSAAQNGVRIEVEGDQDIVVRADLAGMRQVMFNVIGNAIKYSPRGSTVRVTCSLHDAMGVVEVADAGRGIPQDRMSRLFKPFERLGAEHSNIPGTGLGLAISKALVEAMNGAICAESPAAGGCLVRIAFPAANEHRLPSAEGLAAFPGA